MPPEALRAEYIARINRVIDHIENNLEQPLSLTELADVAHFSRFHFHRIFSALVGETLNQFVQRLRIERAAGALLTKPTASITEVALDSGFSSPATFARVFKQRFGMSGSQWRAAENRKFCDEDRKIRKGLSNDRVADWDSSIDPRTHRLRWRNENLKDQQLNPTVEVREQPEYHVAYVRHVGPYGQVDLMPQLFAKLNSWADARGLLNKDTLHLCVAHDSPSITEQAKLRLSVCLTVPEDVKGAGEVGTMRIAGGRCAVARFEMPPARIAEAWNVVMGGWLPQSGYQPDDRPCYEIVVQDPRSHPRGLIDLEICVPVRPM